MGDYGKDKWEEIKRYYCLMGLTPEYPQLSFRGLSKKFGPSTQQIINHFEEENWEILRNVNEQRISTALALKTNEFLEKETDGIISRLSKEVAGNIVQLDETKQTALAYLKILMPTDIDEIVRRMKYGSKSIPDLKEIIKILQFTTSESRHQIETFQKLASLGKSFDAMYAAERGANEGKLETVIDPKKPIKEKIAGASDEFLRRLGKALESVKTADLDDEGAIDAAFEEIDELIEVQNEAAAQMMAIGARVQEKRALTIDQQNDALGKLPAEDDE